MPEPGTIKLKICGMRDPGNIGMVAALAPHYMGFIFFKGSKRFVGNGFEIPKSIPSGIKKVGVFVNDSTHEIIRLAEYHALDFIQLHGGEPVEQCKEVRNNGLGVIKVFTVDEDFDFERVNPFKGFVDYLLFDTKGKNFGGNSIAFDWKILEKYDQEVPFFLSGGISPKNITEVDALREMNLHAVDANSGVEKEVGLKDTELIKELLQSFNFDS